MKVVMKNNCYRCQEVSREEYSKPEYLKVKRNQRRIKAIKERKAGVCCCLLLIFSRGFQDYHRIDQ